MNTKSPQVGLEPTTNRLTADRSTTELLRIYGRRDLNSHKITLLEPKPSASTNSATPVLKCLFPLISMIIKFLKFVYYFFF